MASTVWRPSPWLPGYPTSSWTLPEGGTLVFVKGLGTWLGDDLLML